MRKSSLRNRRHRNPQIQEGERQQPFFSKSNAGVVQKKEDHLPFFQAKLSIGQPGDKYEKEADAVANQVVNAPASSSQVQLKEISSIRRSKLTENQEEEPIQTQKEEDEPVQMMPSSEKEEKEVQMQEEAKEEEPIQKKEGKEEEELQMKAEAGPKTATPQLGSRIEGKSGKGKPIPKKHRSQIENAFGTDFGGVNIHTDAESVQMNKELGAQAFTHGKDVFFNAGKYRPESPDGKRLLAHELTHVVQQNGIVNQPTKGNNSHTDSYVSHQQSTTGKDSFPLIQRKACNFYVHDSTEQTSLGTAWMLAAHGLAKFSQGGYRIPSGESIEGMMYHIINVYANEGCDCIEEIQFLSHGSPGNGMFISKTGEEFTAGDFSIPDLDKFGDGSRGTPEYNAWYDKLSIRQRRLVLLRRLICDSDAEIYYRSCQAFKGKTGQEFAKASARFWRSKVIGHTKIIALSQPGKKVLKSGQEPYWPETEGSESPSAKKPLGIGADQKPKK